MIALYSVENNYDQPDCNLVALFKNKPSIELLAKAIGKSFPCSSDSDTLAIVSIWSNLGGNGYRIGNTDYRLETVEFYDKIWQLLLYLQKCYRQVDLKYQYSYVKDNKWLKQNNKRQNLG